MSGHTPTPWEVDGLAISVGYNKTICVMGEIDGFESGYKPCQNWEANAALIVKAVNSHAALVDACKAVVNASQAGGDTVGLLVDLHRVAILCARALVEADEL